MKADFLHNVTRNKIKNLLKNRVSYAISNISKSGKVSGMPVSLSIEPAAICQLRCPECALGSDSIVRANKLMDFDPEHEDKTFCCPRTWEFVNNIIKEIFFSIVNLLI